MWSQVIALFEAFVLNVPTIAGVIAIISFGVKPCQKFFQYIMTPTIICGLLDSPSSTAAHYYILVKAWNKDLEQPIKLTLIPRVLQQSDYTIVVRSYYEFVGREHWKIDTHEQVIEKNKEINFKLVANVLHRITIQANGGYGRTLASQSITLKLDAQDAVIKCKDHKPPYEDYIDFS
jgi:hypothetical protein